MIRHRTSNPDKWVFGAHFIKDYITLFDYEDNTITFFTDRPIKREYFNDVSIGIQVVGWMMIVMSVVLLSVRMTKGKEEKKKKTYGLIDV